MASHAPETGPASRIMILGHSFVRQNAKFVAETSLRCASPTFHPSTTPAVNFHGIGGRTITKLHYFDLSAVAKFNPTVLILEIGSNDLCNANTAIDRLATNILQFV